MKISRNIFGSSISSKLSRVRCHVPRVVRCDACSLLEEDWDPLDYVARDTTDIPVPSRRAHRRK